MRKAIPYTSLWFGFVVWVLFGGSISAAASWWLYEDYLFAYKSQPTTGIVERVYFTTSHSAKHGTTTTYHVIYHYAVGTLTISTRTSVAYETYRSLSVGRAIPLHYIPAQVGNNRIELPAEQRSVRFATWGLSIAALAIHVIGALVCRYYVRQNNLYQWLLTSGVACQGIVDSVLYDFVGKNRVQRFYLTFTFTDSQGQTHSGKSWYLRVGDELRWHNGNPVHVHFDPAHPDKFTVDLKRSA